MNGQNYENCPKEYAKHIMALAPILKGINLVN